VLFEPFTRDTGIKVVEVTWGGQGLARLRAQLQAGQVEVDLLDGPPFWSATGRRLDLLQPIKTSITDADSHLPLAVGEFAYAYGSTTWGITYNTKAFSSGAPTSWRDFWDVDRIKGRRALFGATPARHVEYALMADGVPIDQVNPLSTEKVDRAFKKLEEIKPKLSVWYQTTSQMETLVTTGEIDCGELTSGRTFFLQSQGAPLQFVFDGAVMNLLIWVMAKNAPNKGNAERFLAFSSRADRQAELATVLFSGPTNKKAFALLKDDGLLQKLPTYSGNYSRQVTLDSDWWADNLDSLSGRWNRLTSG
jgi:putative spermidine/putrescine transport system substrate-binding protein